MDRFVGDLEPAIDDCKGVAHLGLGDAERRVCEERVPPHESVEAFLPEEFATSMARRAAAFYADFDRRVWA